MMLFVLAIFHSLVSSGAGIEPDRAHMSVLHWTVYYEMNEAVKCLLECGTNANKTSSLFITPLHDAVDRSDLSMVITLVNLGARNIKTTEETVLKQCIEKDMYSTTETLLKFGADKNLTSCGYSPLDAAIRQNNYGCVAVLSQIGVGYREGLSFLHRACELGHIDLARLLIIEGGDVNSIYSSGKKEPLEYLPRVNAVEYHVLKGASTAEKTIEKVGERFVCVADIPNMTTALHTPGIGDVRYILKPRSKEITERAFKLLDAATKRNKTSTGKPFHMRAIGSAAEGTRVGLPNEMDILFAMPIGEDLKIVNLGNGYVHYDYVAQRFIKFVDKDSRFSASVCGQDPSRDIRGSAGFHYEAGIGYFNLQTISPCTDEKVSIVKRDTHVHPNDRKACSIQALQWDDGHSKFRIPVDLVPSLHVDDWPVGAVSRTWLMKEQDLRSRGYVLVPKPPHVISELAKDHTDDQLQTLWKISFPHLETEHMQRLEQRVKDVYLTTKYLRNPDVCRIMLKDNDSLPRNVDTSYLLKMCFFKNVEYFREADLSLVEMVCKVYNDLEEGLVNGFIPLFFLPKVSALGGINWMYRRAPKLPGSWGGSLGRCIYGTAAMTRVHFPTMKIEK